MVKMDKSLVGLIYTLNQLFPDLNFTIEKLKNLNQAIMLDLCKNIITYLYDTAPADVWKITDQQRSRSTHPELLMEGIEMLNIFKIMNKIFGSIAPEEFRLVDIIKPEMKRTIYFLKAIVHFRLCTHKYIEEQFVACFHKLNKQETEMNILKNKLEMLNTNIEEKLLSVENFKSEIEQLSEDGKEDTVIVNDLQNKHRCLENELSKLEDSKDKLEKKCNETKDTIEQLIAEKELLRGQIFEDYPKIKGKYQQLLIKKKECEAKISEEKISHATIQDKNEVFVRLETDFTELLNIVSKLEDVFSSNKVKKVEESKLEDLKDIYSKKSAHITHRIEKCQSERQSLLKELEHSNEIVNANKLKEEEYLKKCNEMMDLVSIKTEEYKENVKRYEILYQEKLDQNERLKLLVYRIFENITNGSPGAMSEDDNEE